MRLKSSFMVKVFKFFVIFLLILILLTVCAVTISFFYLQTPLAQNNTDSVKYILKIPSGRSVKQVAEELADNRIIRSREIFYIKAKLQNFKMKAGRYEVSSDMSVDDIFELLESGRQVHITVSIPEGLTVSQIAKLLEESDVILSSEKFIEEAKSPDFLNEYNIPANSAEGYLFPDTYFFNPAMDEKEVLHRLADNFFKKLDELEIPSENPKELFELVTLASIVEREYRRMEEAPLIASVFLNRLKYNIGLESCATIVYIITEEKGRPHPEKVSYEDLKIDSRYNTYKWAGLPPGPISNPGAVALKAVAKPAKTDYFYFRVADSATGTHHFSSSLEEHATAGRNLSIKKSAGQ